MKRNDSSQVASLLRDSDQDEGHPLSQSSKNQRATLDCPSPKPLDSPAAAAAAEAPAPEPKAPAPAAAAAAAAAAEPPPSKRGTDTWPWTEGDSRPAQTSCCLLKDLRQISQCKNHLGPLDYNPTRTVLVDVDAFTQGGIVPQKGRDCWERGYVKLPSSRSSLFFKNSVLKSRWQVMAKYLTRLRDKKTVSVRDVEKLILKYNPKYSGRWSFDALSQFVERGKEINMNSLFQKIAGLALKLPEYVMKGIPLLQRGRTASITLSQVQISCLLANAFFCTFPHRNTNSSTSEYHNYPTINFTGLFGGQSQRKMEKLKAIMHYFQSVTDEKRKLDGLVTFQRVCLAETDVHIWKSCKNKMNKLYVSSHGTIETEGIGLLQVDFASSWLGGGVLGSGLVQEEILFLIHPELIVSRLFTEKLQDNECMVVTGCEQFSNYSGFSDTFRWKGPHEDRTGRDRWSRRHRQILAIDAMNFNHVRAQYKMNVVVRELNKAYCGFKGQEREEPDIATGKWGCGAFKGDPQLKAVIQLMAAAKAERGLAFFTFKDEKLQRGLDMIYRLLVTKGTTVEELFYLLKDYCAVQEASGSSSVELFNFIRVNLSSKSQL